MNYAARRLMVLAGAAAVVTGAIVSAAPSASAAPVAAAGPNDPVTSFTKNADVRITMRDGISLDSDEYVPTTGCPCPVILVQTPYRKSDTQVAEYNPYFPSHGYAEIVVDVRGTGSSEGYWTSFGTPEQLDTVELVNWAEHRPFSNGTIGLAGVSYSAINQFLTVENVQRAEPNNHGIKAIFPIVPMGDAYRDVVFAGGNTDTGFIPLWLGLVNGLNAAPTDDATSQPAIALNVESQHLADVAQFAGPAVADSTLGGYESDLPAQAQTYPDQAYDGPYYRTVDPLSHIEDVHVPTFIVGGEYDLFQRSEPLLYRGLGLPASQKKLLYGPWYHGNPSADLTADDGSSPVHDSNGTLIPSTNNLSLAWFDHWLKGKKNGIDGFPTVETWQIGANRWHPNPGFPTAATPYQPWYLAPSPSGSGANSLYDGSLSTTGVKNGGSAQVPWQPVTGACSKSTAQWTAGIVAVSNCENDDTYAQISGLTFTSPVFTTAYTISGPIVADLWISSTRPDTTLTATVGDVQTDGSVARITAGSLVGSFADMAQTRCGAKVMDCTVYSHGVPVIPWHPYTRASQVALTSSPTEVRIEVFPTNAVIEPGHRLRIAITTADLPHQGPNTSTLANSAGGVTTVYFDATHPSRVFLGTPGVSTPYAVAAPAAANAVAAAPHSAAPAAPQITPAGPVPATLRTAASRVPVDAWFAALIASVVFAGASLWARRRVTRRR